MRGCTAVYWPVGASQEPHTWRKLILPFPGAGVGFPDCLAVPCWNFCLTWSCKGLVYTGTTTPRICVHVPCCVWTHSLGIVIHPSCLLPSCFSLFWHYPWAVLVCDIVSSSPYCPQTDYTAKEDFAFWSFCFYLPTTGVGDVCPLPCLSDVGDGSQHFVHAGPSSPLTWPLNAFWKHLRGSDP